MLSEPPEDAPEVYRLAECGACYAEFEITPPPTVA